MRIEPRNDKQASLATHILRTFAWVLAVGFLATSLVAQPPIVSKPPGSQNPAGHDGFVVAMIDTVLDPATMVLDGNIYFQDILGMTAAEADAFEAEALAYFHERFGIDANDPRLMLSRAYANPELGYRVYHLAGRKVPPEGWELQDGSINVTVVDPDGITLGGEFAGVHVPVGTLFPYGFYVIRPQPPANGNPNPQGPQWDPILIHFRAFEPMLTGPTGSATIRCELFSEEFGTGLAQGIFSALSLPDGNVRVMARNVMTLNHSR